MRTNAKLNVLQKRKCDPIHQRDKVEWAGHVWRADGSMLKGTLSYMVRENIPRGRPRKRIIRRN
jgi:hypothetical protein